VYPGENLNLHIFEPRYKQLIKECHELKRPFGIPSVIGNKMQDYGTMVTITEVTKVYDNDEMDIKTKGEKVFRILEVIKEIPEKLYSGAIVNYPANQEHGSAEVMRRLVSSIRELHKMLNVDKEFKKEDEQLNTYDVAHHVGLTLEQEYELLNLMHERQRQEYLKRHMTQVLPMVAEMEALKVKVKLNGHFKNMSSFNFDL
jgi:Lon protease-like protein